MWSRRSTSPGPGATPSRALATVAFVAIAAAVMAPADGWSDGRPVVLFLGDSLTAGYGLGAELAFPTHVAARLEELGQPIEAINAGVSGDTSAGGLSRLDWLLRRAPDVVVIGLGGNDGLRGLDLAMTEENLRRIVERSRASGAGVLLLGMRMPPNYGGYATDFEAIYARLAEELDVPLVPFLLEGVGGDPALNLPDGIHPNEEGQRRVAENVTPALASLIERLETPAG